MKQHVIPWMIGLTLYLIRQTCRVRIHGDVRKALRSQGNSYIFAMLHAHQIGAGMCADQNTGALVSRSRDGGMVVPALRLFGHQPIRGSGGKARKGGARAITKLIRHVKQGHPACIAVDGPKGPRGHVHGGVAMLAKKTGQPVLPVIVVPTRRWIIKNSWDRLQIPQPFCRISVHIIRPLWIGEDESVDEFAMRIERVLQETERACDPEETDRQASRHKTKPPTPTDSISHESSSNDEPESGSGEPATGTSMVGSPGVRAA